MGVARMYSVTCDGWTKITEPLSLIKFISKSNGIRLKDAADIRRDIGENQEIVFSFDSKNEAKLFHESILQFGVNATLNEE